MDKYELRRLKLMELLHTRCGGISADLAKKIERSDSYVSRMMYPEGKPGKKNIGEAMVDLITTAFNLPKNWFDTIPGEQLGTDLAMEVALGFRSLSLDQQTVVVGLMRSYGVSLPDPSPTGSPPRSTNVQIPIATSNKQRSGAL